MTRYALRHRTAHDYENVVDLAAHLLHLTPHALRGQREGRSALAFSPAPSHRRDGLDHFGNMATWMFPRAPHGRFEVTLDALAEVDFAPPSFATPPWEEVRDAVRARAGWQAAEFALPSGLAAPDAAAGAYARGSFPPGRPILAALRELTSRIKGDFTFTPGVTTISTPVAQMMAKRAGVCQDFAHVMIAGLRGAGIPAAYVSGFLRTIPPKGKPRLEGADAMHAWVRVWCGIHDGWLEFDPTNAMLAGGDHITIGHGRDYADISPMVGVLRTSGNHETKQSVDVIRVE